MPMKHEVWHQLPDVLLVTETVVRPVHLVQNQIWWQSCTAYSRASADHALTCNDTATASVTQTMKAVEGQCSYKGSNAGIERRRNKKNSEAISSSKVHNTQYFWQIVFNLLFHQLPGWELRHLLSKTRKVAAVSRLSLLVYCSKAAHQQWWA